MAAKVKRVSKWLAARVRAMLSMSDEERDFFNEW